MRDVLRFIGSAFIPLRVCFWAKMHWRHNISTSHGLFVINRHGFWDTPARCSGFVSPSFLCVSWASLLISAGFVPSGSQAWFKISLVRSLIVEQPSLDTFMDHRVRVALHFILWLIYHLSLSLKIFIIYFKQRITHRRRERKRSSIHSFYPQVPSSNGCNNHLTEPSWSQEPQTPSVSPTCSHLKHLLSPS